MDALKKVLFPAPGDSPWPHRVYMAVMLVLMGVGIGCVSLLLASSFFGRDGGAIFFNYFKHPHILALNLLPPILLVLLFWFLCRVAACLCMGTITLTLGRIFGNLLPALFVSAVGYCLPALLSLSGMEGGIEWLGFWPLFHAAALLTTQGYGGAEGLPYNYGWIAVLLLAVALLAAGALGGYLRDRYEARGFTV